LAIGGVSTKPVEFGYGRAPQQVTIVFFADYQTAWFWWSLGPMKMKIIRGNAQAGLFHYYPFSRAFVHKFRLSRYALYFPADATIKVRVITVCPDGHRYAINLLSGKLDVYKTLQHAPPYKLRLLVVVNQVIKLEIERCGVVSPRKAGFVCQDGRAGQQQ
jgi:hypothetical protein